MRHWIHRLFITNRHSNPMVDTRRIEELMHEIGEDDLLIVLEMFLSEAVKTIDRIGTGLSDDEHAKATHFLRSGALNIGLVSFAGDADTAAAVAPQDRAATGPALHTSLNDSIRQLGLPINVASPEAKAS